MGSLLKMFNLIWHSYIVLQRVILMIRLNFLFIILVSIIFGVLLVLLLDCLNTARLLLPLDR